MNNMNLIAEVYQVTFELASGETPAAYCLSALMLEETKDLS